MQCFALSTRQFILTIYSIYSNSVCVCPVHISNDLCMCVCINHGEEYCYYFPCLQYSVKVAPNKMLYDCGVLLNEDGNFDRPDYRNHSSPLSLHSFYLLEWATFGVLCMALLTNPEAQGKIHGGLLQQSSCLKWFVLHCSALCIYVHNVLPCFFTCRSSHVSQKYLLPLL